MTAAGLVFWFLTVAGWTAILTRGAGPWGLLAAIRTAWRGGPLGCPLCTGTWIGALATAAELAAARFPQLAAPVRIIGAAGAGAAAAEAYALAADVFRQQAWRIRQDAEHTRQRIERENMDHES